MSANENTAYQRTGKHWFHRYSLISSTAGPDCVFDINPFKYELKQISMKHTIRI